jgi:hypothetical protein
MLLTPSAEGILEELRALCLSLPETVERASFGHPNFLAGKKTFVTFKQLGVATLERRLWSRRVADVAPAGCETTSSCRSRR